MGRAAEVAGQEKPDLKAARLKLAANNGTAPRGQGDAKQRQEPKRK